MAAVDESVCSRAIAYLKVKEFGSSENEVSLSHGDSPIITSLNNSLCVTYVVDEGGHLKYLQYRDCDKSGLSEVEVHKIGVENLAGLARERIQITPYGNIYAVMLDGNFEASLILVDSLWEKGLAHLAPNGFVAAIPARDILAFCDADSAEGIAELLQLIERIQNGDHMLSREIYRRGVNGWRPLNQH
jgi:uncharacterized protein YtpQ (UPF0354 family)